MKTVRELVMAPRPGLVFSGSHSWYCHRRPTAPHPSSFALLVVDDEVYGFQKANKPEEPDHKALAILYAAASEIENFHSIIIAPPGSATPEAIRQLEYPAINILSFVDLYEPQRVTKWEDRQGDAVVRNLKAAGIPPINTIAWTKQPHDEAFSEHLAVDNEKYFAFQRKETGDGGPPQLGIALVRETLQKHLARLTTLTADTIWRTDDEQNWFSGTLVPHDPPILTTDDPKENPCYHAVNPFLVRVLGQQPPAHWYSRANYPWLHYSLKSIVGKHSAAHRGMGQPLSIGGLVFAWLAGLRYTDRAPYIATFEWTSLVGTNKKDVENEHPGKYMYALDLDAVDHRKRILAIADLARALGTAESQLKRPSGFVALHVTPAVVEFHLSFDAGKTKRDVALCDISAEIPCPGGELSGIYHTLVDAFSSNDRKRISWPRDAKNECRRFCIAIK